MPPPHYIIVCLLHNYLTASCCMIQKPSVGSNNSVSTKSTRTYSSNKKFATSKKSSTAPLYPHFITLYSETLNKEYIERIQQMSYSSLSDNGMLQIFSFLIK